MHSDVSLLIAVRLMNEWANCGVPSTVLWEDSINFDWSEAEVIGGCHRRCRQSVQCNRFSLVKGRMVGLGLVKGSTSKRSWVLLTEIPENHKMTRIEQAICMLLAMNDYNC